MFRFNHHHQGAYYFELGKVIVIQIICNGWVWGLPTPSTLPKIAATVIQYSQTYIYVYIL
jgi:hypothetical protein